jgi:hypothetical protein
MVQLWHRRRRSKRLAHPFQQSSNDPYTNEMLDLHPFSLLVKASSADAPTIREVLSTTGDKRQQWFDSMDKEITDLVAKGTFELVDRSSNKGEEIVGCQRVF